MAIQSNKNRTGRQIINEMRNLIISINRFDSRIKQYKVKISDLIIQMEKLNKELIRLNEVEMYEKELQSINKSLKPLIK